MNVTNNIFKIGLLSTVCVLANISTTFAATLCTGSFILTGRADYYRDVNKKQFTTVIATLSFHKTTDPGNGNTILDTSETNTITFIQSGNSKIDGSDGSGSRYNGWKTDPITLTDDNTVFDDMGNLVSLSFSNEIEFDSDDNYPPFNRTHLDKRWDENGLSGTIDVTNNSGSIASSYKGKPSNKLTKNRTTKHRYTIIGVSSFIEGDDPSLSIPPDGNDGKSPGSPFLASTKIPEPSSLSFIIITTLGTATLNRKKKV